MKNILLLTGILYSINTLSQEPLKNFEIKSPQSYFFEKYGNVPVNLYTGAIDLRIPISRIGDGNSSISADLVYDSSGFIPHKKSDVAGMGWSLMAGGRITRNLNGTPDEYVGNNGDLLTHNIFGEVVNLHGFLKGVKSNTSTDNIAVYNVNGGGVGNTNGLKWWLGNYPNRYEGEPDEFSFNAMGLSGKFMVGNDGNVLVQSSDPNIKVDLSEMALYGGALFCVPPASKITLIDGNGTKYIFGGDLSKYEISYSYSIMPNYPNEDYLGYPMINSFSLAKVIYANGREINFDYEVGTLYDNYWCELSNWSSLNENSKIFSMDSYSQDGARGASRRQCANMPLYMCFGSYSSQDSSEDSFVMLKKSILKSIKYQDDEIKINYINIGYPIKHYPDSFDPEKAFNEWVIGNVETYHKNILVKKTELSYDHLGGTFKRPFLKLVKNLYSDEKYSFEYNKTNNLPPYYTKGIDHWGYWNNNDSNTRLAPFDTYDSNTGDYTLNNTFRDANPQNYDVALLNKVTYPTKGFTVFEYEPNYYGKRVERNSTSAFLPTLTNNSGLAGGARIRKIFSYAENGNLSSQKEYKYTTSIAGNTSSGILMNWPRYFYAISGADFGSGHSVNNSWMLKTSSNMQKNSLDSYNVGYGKVFEIEDSKGYVQHNFTTYETHPDIYNPDSDNIRQYINDGQTYTPLNLYKNFRNLYGVDKSILRGRPLTEKYFSQADFINPLKTIDYEYHDNMEFNSNNNKDNNNYVSIQHLSGFWVQGYRRFMNSSHLKKKTIKDYFNGTEVKSETDYFYDSPANLSLSREVVKSSDNTEIKTNYQYLMDIWNGVPNHAASFAPPYAFMMNMFAKNMFSIPLVTTTYKNNTFLGRSQVLYNYSESNVGILPKKLLSYTENKLVASRPYVDLPDTNFATEEVIYDLYDDRGNLQQYTTKDGISTTIIWGYNKTLPIAKITGAKLSDIPTSIITTLINASTTDGQAPPMSDETTFLQALELFRKDVSLSGFQVTTYSHDPLIGVRSITPPSGVREIYKYDSAGRLKEVRENSYSGNLLKEYNYNFKQ